MQVTAGCGVVKGQIDSRKQCVTPARRLDLRREREACLLPSYFILETVCIPQKLWRYELLEAMFPGSLVDTELLNYIFSIAKLLFPSTSCKAYVHDASFRVKIIWNYSKRNSTESTSKIYHKTILSMSRTEPTLQAREMTAPSFLVTLSNGCIVALLSTATYCTSETNGSL